MAGSRGDARAVVAPPVAEPEVTLSVLRRVLRYAERRFSLGARLDGIRDPRQRRRVRLAVPEHLLVVHSLVLLERQLHPFTNIAGVDWNVGEPPGTRTQGPRLKRADE